MNSPRWAGPEDNAALIELVRACPMSGSIAMYFDRSPDYFALSRLQGDGARVCVVEDTDGTLAAAAAVASFPALYVGGEARQVSYACDLKIRPDRRGGWLLKRLYGHMTDWAVREQGWDLGITTVMRGNAAMEAVLKGKGGVVPYRHVATMRNYTVQFLLPKRPPRGITVRRAGEGDVSEMVSFWNRVQAGRQFAPAWSEAELRERLARSPGLALSDYFLAYRGDRLVGLLATWCQESFKQMVVLDYAPEMQRMRTWYNPLSRVLGLARMPDPGHAMPYFYATQLCAEEPDVLRALYVAAYNANRGRRYLFFSTMLDVRDPLNAALEGFITQAVDIELYAMDPFGRYQESPALAYFDPSLV